MTSVFFAPTRQPVMQLPHSVHPVRSGPTPPKNGSATRDPGSPKKTPTGVDVNVSPAPISSATSRMTASAGVNDGLVVTPSIRFACS